MNKGCLNRRWGSEKVVFSNPVSHGKEVPFNVRPSVKLPARPQALKMPFDFPTHGRSTSPFLFSVFFLQKLDFFFFFGTKIWVNQFDKCMGHFLTSTPRGFYSRLGIRCTYCHSSNRHFEPNWGWLPLFYMYSFSIEMKLEHHKRTHMTICIRCFIAIFIFLVFSFSQ